MMLLLVLVLFSCAWGSVVIVFRRAKRRAKTPPPVVLPTAAEASSPSKPDEHSFVNTKASTLKIKCSELVVGASSTLIKTISSVKLLAGTPSLIRTATTFVTEIIHRACDKVMTFKPSEIRSQKSEIVQNKHKTKTLCQSRQSIPLERRSLSSKTSNLTPRRSSLQKDNVMLTIDLVRDVSGKISSAAVCGYPLDVESIRRLKKLIDEQQEKNERQGCTGNYVGLPDTLSAASRDVIQNVVDVVLKYYREQREGNHSKSQQQLTSTWCDKIEHSEFNEKLEFVERLLQEEGNENLFGLALRAQKEEETVSDHQNELKCEYVLTYNGECPIKKSYSDRLSGHHENSSSLTDAPHVKLNRVSLVFDECSARGSVTSSMQQAKSQDNDIHLAVSLHRDQENKISSASIEGHLVNVHSILRLQELIEEQRNGLSTLQTLDSCAEEVVLDLLKGLCEETVTKAATKSHQDTHTLMNIVSSIESNRSIKSTKPSGTDVKCKTEVSYQKPDPHSVDEQKSPDANDLFKTLNIQEVVQKGSGEIAVKTNVSITFVPDEPVSIDRISRSEAKVVDKNENDQFATVSDLQPTADRNPSTQEVITDSGTHVDNFVFTVNLHKDANDVISSASVGRHPLSLESIFHLQELLEKQQSSTTGQTSKSQAELPASLRTAARQVVKHVIDAVLVSVRTKGETPHSSFHRLQQGVETPASSSRRDSLFGQKLETISRVLCDTLSKETLSILHGNPTFNVGELSIGGLSQTSKTPQSSHPNVFSELIIRDSVENVIDGATMKTNISLVFAIEDNAAVSNSKVKINMSNSDKHLNVNTSNSAVVLPKLESSHTFTKLDTDVKNFVFTINVDRDAEGNIGSVSVSRLVSDQEQSSVCADSHVLDVAHVAQLEEQIKSYNLPGKSDVKFPTSEWCHVEASLKDAAQQVIKDVIDSVLPLLSNDDSKKVGSHHDVASIKILKSVSQILKSGSSEESINLKYSDISLAEHESHDVLKHLVIQEMIGLHENKRNLQANVSLIFNIDHTMPPKRGPSGKQSQHKRPANGSSGTKNNSNVSSVKKSSSIQQSKSELLGRRRQGNENGNSSTKNVSSEVKHGSRVQTKVTQVSSGDKKAVKTPSKSILKKDSAKGSTTGEARQSGTKRTSFSNIKVVKESASKEFSHQGSVGNYSENSSLDILPMYSQQLVHVNANVVAKELDLESQGHAVSEPALLQKDANSDSDCEIEAEINVTPMPSATKRITGEDRQRSPSFTRPKSRRENYSKEDISVKGSKNSVNSTRSQVVRKRTSEELSVNVNTNATPGGDVTVKPEAEEQRAAIKFGREYEREWIAIYKRRLKNRREMKMKMGNKPDWKI